MEPEIEPPLENPEEGSQDDPLDEESQDRRAGESQLERDLAIFDLKPPVRLEAVRKRRNELAKVYHADRYGKNAEKNEAAEEIMKIYNKAYERLEKILHEEKR